jgi:hypothetical protein
VLGGVGDTQDEFGEQAKNARATLQATPQLQQLTVHVDGGQVPILLPVVTGPV